MDTATILIVDDRPENLLALEGILEPLGQQLVRATSGDEALKELLVRDVAVILLDVQMPGLNGFETARIIKSRDRTKHIPIIFLTAISTEDMYVAEGYSVGAVDYLSKPFRPAVLRSKVAVFVDLYLKSRALERQAALLREGERRELELRHKARLSESEARFAAIVDSAMDAIVTFDSDRTITLFNAAAERMFGCKAESLIGKHVGECFPEQLRGQYLQQICGNDAKEAPEQGMLSMVGRRTDDGREFPIEASVSCVVLPSTRIYTVIARDVTDRLKAEEALRAQTASLEATTEQLRRANAELDERHTELERALHARNRFYASMSHELRTPINAILGYLRLLLDEIYGPMNDRQRHSLERTRKAAEHLLELVNDALDLSKIEAGKIELAVEPVTFPALLEDLFVTVKPMAEEQGCELTIACDAVPTVVLTDPRRVRQILLNLLSNAMKFGKHKPIGVACHQLPGGGVEIAVSDHGDGIPPDELGRIFDEFVQVGKPREQEGTGLGLPISKRLAELLDGWIDVTSELGRGSTFRLILPKAVSLDGAREAGPGELDVTGSLTRLDGLVDATDASAALARPAGAEPAPTAAPQ